MDISNRIFDHFINQINHMALCVSSQHSIIPNSISVESRLGRVELHGNIRKYHMRVPIKSWSKISLQVESQVCLDLSFEHPVLLLANKCQIRNIWLTNVRFFLP